MKKNSNCFRVLLVVLVAGMMLAACKEKPKKDEFADVKGTYFPIREYAINQWNTFAGAPFTILKVVKNDDKTDSSYTNSDTLNWGNIFHTFFETDISDRKFLGKYTYTQFDDNEEGTHNFFYKANDDELFTQKLLITLDMFTNKVKGIYIETYKKTFLNEVTQKLYYSPMKTIQIQTDDKPGVGARKFSVVQYYFMR